MPVRPSPSASARRTRRQSARATYSSSSSPPSPKEGGEEGTATAPAARPAAEVVLPQPLGGAIHAGPALVPQRAFRWGGEASGKTRKGKA